MPTARARRVTRPVPAPRPASEPSTVAAKPGKASFVLLIVALLSLGLAALLGVNTALAQSSFTVSRLQKKVADLDDQSASLQEKLSRSTSPDALAADAKKLGMVQAVSLGYVRLADGSISGHASVAGGPPQPLTPEQAAAAAAAQERAAEKAAQDQIDAEAKAQAAADAAAAAARAKADEEARKQAAARAARWQQKLADQEKGGARHGGEAVVVAPPGPDDPAPAAPAKPAAEAKPAGKAKPVEEAKPPAGKGKPAAATKPAAQTKPAAATKHAAQTKPVRSTSTQPKGTPR
jgi:hypothetical protein